MRESHRDGASPGEIVVRAPWLTSGYSNNPEASEQLWAGGYLHTDDIGVITPDGHLQITDRIKDVIKSGGTWISSLELEDIIMRRDGVAECAVMPLCGGYQVSCDRFQRQGCDFEICRAAEDFFRRGAR